MNDIETAKKEAEKSLIPNRLLVGAEVLGNVWRSGPKCGSSDWSEVVYPGAHGEPVCLFCRRKAKWIELYSELRGVLEPGQYSILLSMTPKEFSATGLTILFEWNGHVIPVGPKGTGWETFRSIFDIPEEGRAEAWAVAAKFIGKLRTAIS